MIHFTRVPVRATALATLLALVAVLAPGQATVADRRPDGPGIDVLSSPRAELVSGGDVLVGVRVPRGTDPDRVRLRAGERDVTTVLRQVGRDRFEGLVDGLREGRTRLTASVRGSWRRDSVVVTNHPAQGPMLAGPHEEPFICSVQDFTTLAGSRLGTPDEDCATPSRVEHVYRTTDDTFAPLADPAARPADLAYVTRPDGRRVPYVVRVESGVINRSIYEVAVLADEQARNERLVYNFGGGCPGGWYQQGAGTAGVADDHLLSRGYAVASASLNVMGNNCNPVLATETMAMVKEHVVETLGVPALTIGTGCSGGSYQVFQIADSYPGLLDAVLAGCVFPEVAFATLHTITDARLLDQYFARSSGWTAEQQRAVSGFGRLETVANLSESARRIDPRVFCPDVLPEALRYDPVLRPGGARCDVYSHQINVWGDAGGGVPRRPLDNVGIQYGLQAWRDGTITADQFLDLNASVGGFDDDANVVRDRTVADRGAIRTAYRTGQMLDGGGGLRRTPVIELREYTDLLPNGDIHLRFHSFSFRERLRQANGTAANHVMWTESTGHGGFGTANAKYRDAIALLDAWGTASKARGSTQRSVLRTRPARARDACWSPDDTRRVVTPQVDGVGVDACTTWYPSYPSPRQVAGAPVVNDVIACRTTSPRRAAYPRTSDAQWRRLRATFPRGVCDWTRRGIGEREPGPAWPRF